LSHTRRPESSEIGDLPRWQGNIFNVALLDSILFMYLKVIWIYSRKAMEAGSSSDHLILSSGWTA
jgi:hypothetical protein